MIMRTFHTFDTLPPTRQQGLSLVELMIAMTLSLLLMTGLVTFFVNASSNQREMQKNSTQIENGRYALDTLIQDLHLAGFYGAFSSYAIPAALPDPCDMTESVMLSSLALGVQGYQAGSLSAKPTPPTACASLLTAANLAPGSDILVVRYAEPAPWTLDTATTAGDRYIQANPITAVIQNGGGTIDCGTDALGAAATITRKCTVPTSVDRCTATCTGGGSPAGDIRKMNVRIYFVAPCSIPASGALCTGSTDDSGSPIPTLKRLELTSSGFSIVPVAEGVELMKIEYGVDSSPTTTNASTGLIGDGVPDSYNLTPALADFANAVSVRVDLLVRNPQATAGYSSAKTYNLGVDPTIPSNPAVVAGPFTDAYRRHVYAGETRLSNLAGRKENP
jgi:type IV pilus assembly protein PilW